MKRFSKSQKVLRAIALFNAILASAGCGSSGGPYYPARGKVLVDGKPAAGAIVTLVPSGDSKDRGPKASGTVGADGVFTLTTYDAVSRRSFQGARAGQYLVLITWPPDLTREGLNEIVPITDRLYGRFSDAKASSRRTEIKTAATELPLIELHESDLITNTR